MSTNTEELAVAQRAEAKRLLGEFMVDQQAADRIVDCIVGAAMLEVVGMMRERMRAFTGNGDAV